MPLRSTTIRLGSLLRTVSRGALAIAAPFSVAVASAPAIPLAAPSAFWTGTAGSGFNGALPSDPVRTNAKPIAHLLVTPLQEFAEDLLLVVGGDAGGLAGVEGVASWEALIEGTTVPMAAPAWHTYTDANGSVRRMYGASCRLDHSAFMAVTGSGTARCYFRATPTDPTMQARVIGPFDFYPRASLYEVQLTVTPSQGEIVGSRYQNLRNALAYIRTVQNAKSALITITESGDYPLIQQASSFNAGVKWVVITHAPGVTARLTSNATLMRPGYDGLCFRGSGIVLDPIQMGTGSTSPVRQLYAEDASNKLYWFDGCTISSTQSGGRYALMMGGYPPGSFWLRTETASFVPNYFFTDVIVDDVFNGPSHARLVRNPVMTDIAADGLQSNKAVHAPSGGLDGMNPQPLRDPLNSLTVVYTGASAAATFERPARSGFTATCAIRENGTIPAGFNGGVALPITANTTMQDVANAINAVAGWSATVDSNVRSPAYLLRSTDLPSVTSLVATSVKTTPVTFTAQFDVHGDVAQYFGPASTSITENLLLEFLSSKNCDVQHVLIDQTNNLEVRDFLIRCYEGTKQGSETLFAQFASTEKHVVVRNMTLWGQKLALRADFAGQSKYNPDAYCSIRNCAMDQVEWNGTPDTDVQLARINSRTAASPSGATNSTTATTNLYVNAPSDLSPVVGGNLLLAGRYMGARVPGGEWNV